MWHADEIRLQHFLIQNRLEDGDRRVVRHTGCRHEWWWDSFPLQTLEDLVAQVEFAELVVQFSKSGRRASYQR